MSKNVSVNERDTRRASISAIMRGIERYHGSKLLPKEQQAKMRSGDVPVELVLVAGPPGPGKTQVGMKTLEAIARKQGLKPVRYRPGILPTGPNDCIIGYRSAAEMMRMDLLGIPNLYEVEENELDDNFQPIVITDVSEMTEQQKEKHLKGEVVYKTRMREAADYRYPDFWATVKAFPYAALMLDEINRSMCQSQFLALLNGDDVEGLKLPPSLVIGTLNEGASDGNDVEAMSTALRTRAAIYYTKPDVEAWINDYAIDAGIHPCCIAFAKLNPQVFERFMVPDDEMVATPTLRGITRLSDALQTYEIMNPNASGENIEASELERLVFARLGEHKETPNLPGQFAKLYKIAFKTVIPQVRLVMGNPNEFETGLTEDFSNILSAVYRSKGRTVSGSTTAAQAAENRAQALMYQEYLVREFVMEFERELPNLVYRHIAVYVNKDAQAPKEDANGKRQRLVLTPEQLDNAKRRLQKDFEDGKFKNGAKDNENYVKGIAYTLMRRFVRGLTPLDQSAIKTALASLKSLDSNINWSDDRYTVARLGLSNGSNSPKNLVWDSFVAAFRSYEPNTQQKRIEEQAKKMGKTPDPETLSRVAETFNTLIQIFKDGADAADLSFAS